MKWLQVKSLEDLKKIGSFNEVRQSIKNDLGNYVSIKSSSWLELWESVQTIQKLSSTQLIKQTQENATPDIADESLLYFKSEAARVIYALVELDQEYRLKELGADKSHYKNSEKAKQWRNELAKIIHPDRCNHPKATVAINELTKLYENMVGQ